MNKWIAVIVTIVAISSGGNSLAALPDAIKAQYPANVLEGRITLNAPELAEDGAVVPVSIKSVNVPANTSVREIAFYSANNPQCPIASFRLTPAMLSEGLATRIKLAGTTDVFAVATLDDGSVISGERKVKVTIGGCGGGGVRPDFSQMNFCTQK